MQESIHGKPRASLVRLHQCVAPAAIPPPPLDQWLKKITAAQVRTVMEDLMKEADRINDAKKKKGEEVSKARNSAGFDLSAYIHQLGSGRGYC